MSFALETEYPVSAAKRNSRVAHIFPWPHSVRLVARLPHSANIQARCAACTAISSAAKTGHRCIDIGPGNTPGRLPESNVEKTDHRALRREEWRSRRGPRTGGLGHEKSSVCGHRRVRPRW